MDEKTASIIETTGNYVGITMSVHYLVSVLTNSSLGALISSIKALQIITHLSLMPVIIPANAQIFFSYICSAVSFDPIDIQESVEKFFDLKQTDGVELTNNFVELGYESSYLLSNLGSLLLIFVFEFTVILMTILLYFAPVKCKKLKRWSSRKLSLVFFDVLLTTIDGTFFVTLMMAMINIKQ